MRRVVITLLAAAAAADAQSLPKLSTTRDVFIDGTASTLAKGARVVIAPNGTAYVTEFGSAVQQVRIFGPDGRQRATFGRSGSGPGDFRSPLTIGLVGDSLWVNDTALARVTIVAPDGKSFRVVPVKEIAIPKPFPVPVSKYAGRNVEAVLPDGSMLRIIRARGAPEMGRDFGGYPVVMTTPAGAFDRLAGWVPLSRDFIFTKDAPGGFLDIPYPNVPVRAFAPAGGAFVTVTADMSSEIALARVTVLRARGDTAYSRTIPVSAQPIGVDDVARAYDEWIAAHERHKELAKLVPLFRAAPRPIYYPPLDRVSISTSGWVLLGFRAYVAERDYLVLDPRGQLYGSLRLPERTEIMQFDGPVIWARENDRNGIPSIIRYRITRPPA